MLFAASVVLVAVLLLWPEHVDGWFASLVWQLPLPAEARVVIYEFSQAFANVLLFVPVGLFASLWLSRWWWAIVVGFALSAVLESLQLTLPGRTFDLWDVVWNALGSALGAGIGLSIRRWRGRTGRQADH